VIGGKEERRTGFQFVCVICLQGWEVFNQLRTAVALFVVRVEEGLDLGPGEETVVVAIQMAGHSAWADGPHVDSRRKSESDGP
jgi:hypothetical protein